MNDLAQRVLDGDPRAIARAISLIEDETPVDEAATEVEPEEDVDFTEAVARQNINPEEIDKEEG